MTSQKEYGTIVVGLGMAGKVRVRDLKEETCALRLKGVVSRRPVELDVQTFSFDEAVSKSDVDVLIVSTEPTLHEEYVRKGLDNGKHVLVEYPLALSSATARSLFDLADQRGLVLQEENIALLVDSFLVVKAKAGQVELKSAEYSLHGSYNGWIEDFKSSGLPFITGVSGIQSMLELFGDLTVVSGKLETLEHGYIAQADLKTLAGKPIKITLSRFKSNIKREKKVIFEFADNEVLDTDKIPSSPHGKQGLFLHDLENFSAQIETGKTSDHGKWLTIRSLEIAEEIHSFF